MPELDDKRLARPDGEGRAFQVISGAAGLFEAPDAEARLASQALHGEVLQIYRQENGFGLARAQRDHYVGWIALDAVSAEVVAPTHKVSALRTFAFTGPDLKTRPQYTLSLGAQLVTTGRREGVWVECHRAGWVYESHLAPLNKFEDDPAAVARRFLGTPYLWGGRESLGLDCTGLTQQAFEACGLLLPRDSDMQSHWLTQTDQILHPNQPLSRNDLVFWRGHVGILTAPDTLLHANAHHLQVAEEPLAEAIDRIAQSAGPVTVIRRIDLAAARRKTPSWYRA